MIPWTILNYKYLVSNVRDQSGYREWNVEARWDGRNSFQDTSETVASVDVGVSGPIGITLGKPNLAARKLVVFKASEEWGLKRKKRWKRIGEIESKRSAGSSAIVYWREMRIDKNADGPLEVGRKLTSSDFWSVEWQNKYRKAHGPLQRFKFQKMRYGQAQGDAES